MKKLLFLLLPLFLFGLSVDFNSFSADFTQTVTNEHKKKITYTGSLSVKKPDKAVWNYKKPVKKELYIDGAQIVVYEPDLMQAIYMSKKSVPNINEMLEKAVLIGNGKYKTKNGNRDVTFMLDGQLPQNINYTDDMGNTVEIVFSNQKRNPSLSAGTFEFKAPAGTDILRQ